MFGRWGDLGLVVSLAILLSGLGGCGGSDCCVCIEGGARGWVYQPIGGGEILLSASSVPPAGYEPVPEGSLVRIDENSALQCYTTAEGYYVIYGVPAGLHRLVVDAPGRHYELWIPIVCNRITDGGGHSEGGG